MLLCALPSTASVKTQGLISTSRGSILAGTPFPGRHPSRGSAQLHPTTSGKQNHVPFPAHPECARHNKSVLLQHLKGAACCTRAKFTHGRAQGPLAPCVHLAPCVRASAYRLGWSVRRKLRVPLHTARRGRDHIERCCYPPGRLPALLASQEILLPPTCQTLSAVQFC